MRYRDAVKKNVQLVFIIYMMYVIVIYILHLLTHNININIFSSSRLHIQILIINGVNVVVPIKR